MTRRACWSRSCWSAARSSPRSGPSKDVRLPAAGLHRFHHPEVGVLDLSFEAASLRADPGLTLLLATGRPGSPTEAALGRLAAGPV